MKQNLSKRSKDRKAICKISGEGGKEVTRPLAPRSLRSFTMRNYHSSIWACHRGQHATNDGIAKRVFWPKMREDANNFVSTCKVCQMAKALKPSNVGWPRGRRHSPAMNEWCIDLIGPIGGSTTRHVQHANPLRGRAKSAAPPIQSFVKTTIFFVSCRAEIPGFAWLSAKNNSSNTGGENQKKKSR